MKQGKKAAMRVEELSKRVEAPRRQIKGEVKRVKEATIESKEAGTPTAMAAASPTNVGRPSGLEVE